MTRSRRPRTRLGWAESGVVAGAVFVSVDFTRLSDRQEVTIKLFVTLPAQPFVEPLRGEVAGGSFEHQSIGLGAFGKLAGAIHECVGDAVLTGVRSDVQVVEDPLAGEVGRG